jgi:hypothetical protein
MTALNLGLPGFKIPMSLNLSWPWPQTHNILLIDPVIMNKWKWSKYDFNVSFRKIPGTRHTYVVSTALTIHCDHMHSNPALYLSGLQLTPAVLTFFMTVLNSTQIMLDVFPSSPFLFYRSPSVHLTIWSEQATLCPLQPRYFYPQRRFSVHLITLRCQHVIATWCMNPKYNHYLNKNHCDSMSHLPKNSKQSKQIWPIKALVVFYRMQISFLLWKVCL